MTHLATQGGSDYLKHKNDSMRLNLQKNIYLLNFLYQISPNSVCSSFSDFLKCCKSRDECRSFPIKQRSLKSASFFAAHSSIKYFIMSKLGAKHLCFVYDKGSFS